MNRPAIKPIRKIPTKNKIEGIKFGSIVEIDSEGVVLVDFNGNQHGPMRASLTATMAAAIAEKSEVKGMSVLIAFEENDADQPVIIDTIQDRIIKPNTALTVSRNDLDDVRIDGETVTFDAKKEIVLRCGKSSITLTRAGKVLIRGSYLLSRSSGVNHIRGGSVHLN